LLTNVIRLIPAAGLVRTAADGTWQVRADTFAFAVQTAFPLTEADLCGSGAPTLYTPPATEPPYYVAIRPMDIAGVTSVMDITVTDTSVPPGTGVLNIGTQWNWTANLAGVPAAMWGAPDGSTNPTTPSADTLPNRLMGINGLSPQATQPAGPAPIPIANCLMARTRYWSRSRCRCCW
jgi:hypothetical protein